MLSFRVCLYLNEEYGWLVYDIRAGLEVTSAFPSHSTSNLSVVYFRGLSDWGTKLTLTTMQYGG